MAVDTANVVVEELSEAHGEIIVNPKPDPNNVDSSVIAAAATEPAKIGPQFTALALDSTAHFSIHFANSHFALLSHEQKEEQDDRNWNSE